MIQALLISNVLLWIAVLVLAVITAALVRQLGILHERIAPVGAMLQRGGTEVGQVAGHFELKTLSGASLIVGPSAEGSPPLRTLLFFLSPTCPLCKTLLPTVLRLVNTERKPLRLVFASDGADEDHHGLIAAHGLDAYDYVLSTALGLSFGVSKLPYAVLLDAQGVVRAKGLVNTREHLESLFEAERLGLESIQQYLAERNREGRVAGEAL